jgi:hypothetical protein
MGKEALHPRGRSPKVPMGKLARLASAAPVLAALSLAHCADEPKPYCITSSSSYAVKLVVQGTPVESTPGACDTFGPASFNVDPEAGFSSYFAQDDKGQPDYSKGTLAVQTTEVETLLQTAQGFGLDNMATDGTVYSLGPYATAQVDDNNFCNVPTLAKTHLVLAAIPPSADMTFPGQDAVDITLTWSNVQVYVTAGTIGTQIQGDLVDTRLTPTGDSCTFTYKALALAPAIPCTCAAGDTLCTLDDMGNPVPNPDGSIPLDPTLCDPQPNPALDRFLGSGIGPATKYTCDTTLGWCTIAGDSVPALQ